MNTILAKNTNRRLVFNPETDIILINTQPHTNQAVPPLPVENFEIWAYAVPANSTVSYGGYAGIDVSGAGVLALAMQHPGALIRAPGEQHRPEHIQQGFFRQYHCGFSYWIYYILIILLMVFCL
jgi:hypothetical protein